MNFNETPRANRLHIGLFGKRNSGKSSLINALTGQNLAIVSPYAGTTADPVFKAMELNPVGPVVFIDTAGFDDEGQLGLLRVEKTKEVIKKTDIAILVFSDANLEEEQIWIELLKEAKIPIIGMVNKADILQNAEQLKETIMERFCIDVEIVSAINGQGLSEVKKLILRNIPENFEIHSITKSYVDENDVVLLVMPQDIQAPKGRLILPQVQTIRDLLDNHCIVMCTTLDKYSEALANLKNPPKLVITDSQCFSEVYKNKPDESLITSFSILFAAYKGDISAFIEGAKAIDKLNEQSVVLISEACTHAPLEEDIGRVKIPNLLRKIVGQGLKIEVVAGNDFPEDLSKYDLIIHCGGCMFNRKFMLSRVNSAIMQNVPITNYGVTLAKLSGILDKVVI